MPKLKELTLDEIEQIKARKNNGTGILKLSKEHKISADRVREICQINSKCSYEKRHDRLTKVERELKDTKDKLDRLYEFVKAYDLHKMRQDIDKSSNNRYGYFRGF